MQEKVLFETLEEIEEYFTECRANAVPGGKAWEKFSRYLDTLAEVKKLMGGN